MQTLQSILIIILCSIASFVNAQFVLLSDASSLGDSCYELTSDDSWELGAVYHNDKIDFSKTFELSFSINLGCNNSGADGIYCIFQNEDSLALGDDGGYMGFGGAGSYPLIPSVGIEFDTYYNYTTGFSDPTTDHLAIMKNGSVDHSTNLAGPVDILPGGANAEDCSEHEVLITWQQDLKTITVYVDCDLRLSYNGDIVDSIFSGENLVYWGFSAATGYSSNEHTVCFHYLKYLEAVSDTTICSGDTIMFELETDFDIINWSPDYHIDDIYAEQPEVWPDISTEYIVTLEGGCSINYSDTVYVETNPTIEVEIDTVICTGTTYVLPDGSTTAASGTYFFSLPAFTGCDSNITVNITVSDDYIFNVYDTICDGEIFILPDSSIATISGMYINNFSTISGCDSTITTYLSVTEQPSSETYAEICSGEFYFFPDGSSTTSAGTYTTYIPSSGVCDSVITTYLTVYPEYAISLSAEICNGSVYVLPDGSIADSSGIYTSAITSIEGCDSIITTTITELDSIITNIDAQICEGNTYTLPDGSSTSGSGVFSNNFISDFGCDSLVTVSLTVHPNPEISFITDSVICIETGYYTLSATPPGGYFVGENITGNQFSPVDAGVGGPYNITYYYTDINGCSDTAFSEITVDANFAEAFGDTTITSGDSAFVFGNTGADYTWSPNVFMDCFNCPSTVVYPPQSIVYTLSTVNENGCIASDDVSIEVLEEPGSYLFIPNTFSPNGDQINDVFFAYSSQLESILFIQIYDRWGELLYEVRNISPNDLTKGWDGMSKGKYVNPGVYAYMMKFQFQNGELRQIQGNVTLLR